MPIFLRGQLACDVGEVCASTAGARKVDDHSFQVDASSASALQQSFQTLLPDGWKRTDRGLSCPLCTRGRLSLNDAG